MEDPKSIFEKATPLVVGGVTYQLVFNHKALALAEKSTGHNMLRWFSSLEMGVNDLAGMLLACLKKHHPEMTLDDVFKILDTVGIGPAFEAVVTAWKQAQPPNVQAAAG